MNCLICGFHKLHDMTTQCTHTQRGSELANTLGNWNNGKDQETNEENAFDEDEKKTRSNTLSSFSN